ncbi:MAG: TIGR00730 family Rossman fold protein [Gammaproteobacteria bacterium]|nr:TIGR00730 family Rossman fold protein [Gammaproteobacteria bacterium]
MRSICVYCGSSPGRREEYAVAARALGSALAQRGLRLVYGGASVGLMGVVADAVMAAGGEVVGLIPDALMRKEVAHHSLTELIVTRSMHERKTRMAELSDGFIALPGGIGTFEELFEIWTWLQLGFHRKPCGILNVQGYYDGLLNFLDHARDEGLLAPRVRDLLQVENDPQALLDSFAQWQAPDFDRWIGRGEL